MGQFNIKNNKGFSLIEIIIVLAIISLIAGGATSMYGHIKYANTIDAVDTIDNQIGKLRVQTMSKSGYKYLVIKKEDDAYYYQIVDANQNNTSKNNMTHTDRKKLCNGSISISFKYKKLTGSNTYTETTKTLENNEEICIGYKKNGSFYGDTESFSDGSLKSNCDEITINGNQVHTITLVRETGMHYAK